MSHDVEDFLNKHIDELEKATGEIVEAASRVIASAERVQIARGASPVALVRELDALNAARHRYYVATGRETGEVK